LKTLIIIFIFFVSGESIYSDDIPKEFQKLLDKGKLTFQQPAGMKLTDVIKDSLMRYDIAYKDEKNNFEIRISIQPLGSKDKPKDNLDILSLAKEGSYQAIDLTPELFNSDKAGSAEFDFEKEYGQGYKFGSILFLIKEKCASVYIFYLGVDKNTFAQHVIDNLFLVKFKK
jgi:hypothetical protein